MIFGVCQFCSQLQAVLSSHSNGDGMPAVDSWIPGIKEKGTRSKLLSQVTGYPG